MPNGAHDGAIGSSGYLAFWGAMGLLGSVGQTATVVREGIVLTSPSVEAWWRVKASPRRFLSRWTTLRGLDAF